LVRSTKWSWLKAWAMQIKKAIVALARRLAVIMHRIWVNGTEFPMDPGTSRMKTVQDEIR
jgi:transposase